MRKMRLNASYLDCLAASEPVCPFCGEEYGESWELKDGEEVECDSCGEIYMLDITTTVSYTTRPKGVGYVEEWQEGDEVEVEQ